MHVHACARACEHTHTHTHTQGTWVQGQMEMSGKMLVLMDIVKQAKEQGHKTIVFSQYQVRNAKPYTMCPLP